MSEYKITNANFEQEVLNSDKPAIVDFWAEWCGPCRMMAPVFEEIAKEHPEWKICKVNVDEEQLLAAKFAISAIPTFLLFKDGKLAGSARGYQTKEQLLSSLGL